jgi:acetyl-CoA carboxylase biotin carboxyl carrier protein
MNQEDLRELIHLLAQKDIAEFSIEHPDATVRIKRRTETLNRDTGTAPSTFSTTQTAIAVETYAPTASAVAPLPDSSLAAEQELHVVKSQMVGIFHRYESPGRPFLHEGDMVSAGQIVGVVEVLRLMHEVTSDVAGEVLEIITEDREPVEYGQPLLTVRLQR